ncbi:MAG: hypothetical protein RLZZ511_4100 [Cyanobacteriota bacterium]|jgi:hypothetical protein
MSTDLSGTWLGTYWQADEPVRFEASLVQGGSSLSGRVQDESALGEAQVVGDVVGRKVSFTKTYLSAGGQAVEYAGTIDESGDLIQGNWMIRGTRYAGTWEARRNENDLMQQLRRRIEQKVPVGAK